MKEWTTEHEGAEPEQTKENRRAEARAMKLLLNRMMTEKEMRERLLQEGFEPDPVEAAIQYCSSFGYLSDARYAENYLISMRRKKSGQMIRRELEERGVSEDLIEQAFEENPYEESDVVDALIRKKAGSPHRMDEKELRRTFAFAARKGFASSEIWKAIHRFQDAENEEEEL
ncbi:MAG: regulatory protein RecX [Eubacteriales bacterium]